MGDILTLEARTGNGSGAGPKTLEGARLNRESTKSRILQAAETLFADKGYKGATIRDIAELAGVNIALVNYHWGSKEELWNAVRTRHMGEVMEFARALASEFPSIDSPEVVRAVVHRFFDFIAGHPNLVKMMAHAGAADAPPEALVGMGPSFLDLGVKYVEGTGVFDFGPVDTRLALICILGAFVIFFIRPDIIRILFGEDPENYSAEFREKAAEALSLLVQRFGAVHPPDRR